MADPAAVASAIIAGVVAVGATGNWIVSRRERQLRTDDVLAWANRSIECLQSVHLVCRLAGRQLDQLDASQRLTTLAFQASILAEQGRLFFKNIPNGTFGMDKPEAYRGLRPLILDCLVLGYQVACAWETADDLTKLKLGLIAEDGVRRFVTLVRGEVGREASASGGAAKEGYGVNLDYLLPHVSEQALRARNWL